MDQNSKNLTDLSKSLTADYGYTLWRGQDFLWVLNSSKHPEHSYQQEMSLKVRNALKKITADGIPDDAKDSLKKAISYYDELLTRYPSDDKDDRKIRYSAYFNKATIYLYLDEPEKAIEEAEALKTNGYDVGDGRRLRNEAERLIEKFRKNSTTTRHFVVKYTHLSLPPVKVIWTEQNQKFRVQKIRDSRFYPDRGSDAVFEYEEHFIYSDDGILRHIKKTEKGKPVEGRKLRYTENEILLEADQSKRLVKKYIFERDRLKYHSINSSNIISFVRTGDLINSLTHDDFCNKQMMTFVFNYAQDRIDRLSVKIKERGPDYFEKHQVVYDKLGHVINIDRSFSDGKVTNSYALEWSGNQVVKISEILQGKPIKRMEFDYDDYGNINHQRLYIVQENGKEYLYRLISVEYEKEKGNDYILWQANHWVLNCVVGVRSYIDLEFPCY